MFKKLATATIALGALAVIGCSAKQNTTVDQSPFAQFLRNLTASQCADPSTAIANVPSGFLNAAQMEQIANAACAGMFGTVAAPVTATGNVPAIPAAPAAPVATPAASPAPVAPAHAAHKK